jgi:large conductance mechanosensitive channel
MKDFIEFIRKQGVIGLAIGFILGGAVSKVVSALVSDIINPIIGIFLGKIGNLSAIYIHIGSASISLGHFISILIDFLIVAWVVYAGFKYLKLDKLDKKE